MASAVQGHLDGSRDELGSSCPYHIELSQERLGSVQGRAVAFSRSQHRVVTYCMLISTLFSLILNIPRDGVSISFFLGVT